MNRLDFCNYQFIIISSGDELSKMFTLAIDTIKEKNYTRNRKTVKESLVKRMVIIYRRKYKQMHRGYSILL